MFATIRNYTTAPELADQLAARASEVEEIISAVPGFQAYYLVRTEGGCTTISVYDDAAGAEESSRRAADYLRERAGEITASAPAITSGDVLVSFGATARV